MKSINIKDLSEQIGVGRSSIYVLIKKHNIPTVKRRGMTYLDENGYNLIAAYYNVEQHETISDIIADTHADTQNAAAEDNKNPEYTRIISLLEDERNEKNKIIQGLLESNRVLTQALAADKVKILLHDKQAAEATATETPTRPKGIFSRLFGRG